MTAVRWIQEAPVGLLTVEVGPDGLRRISLRPEAGAGDQPVEEVARQLEEYFAGARRSFDIELDLSLVGGFHRRVLETLYATVGYGEWISYGELAASAGRPGAARAAGHAMSRNPIAVVVPCHRVLSAGGRLHAYGGGLDMKRALLELEGLSVPG